MTSDNTVMRLAPELVWYLPCMARGAQVRLSLTQGNDAHVSKGSCFNLYRKKERRVRYKGVGRVNLNCDDVMLADVYPTCRTTGGKYRNKKKHKQSSRNSLLLSGYHVAFNMGLQLCNFPLHQSRTRIIIIIIIIAAIVLRSILQLCSVTRIRRRSPCQSCRRSTFRQKQRKFL